MAKANDIDAFDAVSAHLQNVIRYDGWRETRALVGEGLHYATRYCLHLTRARIEHLVAALLLVQECEDEARANERSEASAQ